jgi:hypothetical protein
MASAEPERFAEPVGFWGVSGVMEVRAEIQAALWIWKLGRIYAPCGEKREEKRLTGAPFLFINPILQKNFIFFTRRSQRWPTINQH